ncbi:protein GVQW3-like [Stegodyphus dumicola]|uniref:protein GVQW3-like n=1 Tax=Stegodyphus dumicola TaxID=202533 RepID=UPI0015B21149|nr:protein GVQW3-like [Stegodyphus dumicola]
MCAAIENPASCEVRSVIRFLLAKNLKPMEIYWQECEVYGNNIMNETSIRKWCIQFKNGRTNVHDEEKSGRPSIATDKLVAKVDEKIHENRSFTITKLLPSFPQVSRTLLFEIVTQKLGYRKFCARWVSKLLTDHYKGQRMGAALTFLEAYGRHGDSLLDRIVTSDKWVRQVNCETSGGIQVTPKDQENVCKS